MRKDCSDCVAYGKYERALLLRYVSDEQCKIYSGYQTVGDVHKIAEDKC